MTLRHARRGKLFGWIIVVALGVLPLRAADPQPADKKGAPPATAPAEKPADEIAPTIQQPAQQNPAPGEKKEESEPASKDAAPAVVTDAAPDPAEHDRQTLELLKVFVDSLDQIERNYVTPIDRRELMEAAINGMLEKLDPYSSYIAPDHVERFRTAVESQFGGIGIQVSMEQGVLKIVTPLVGTPAYRAGLMAGDTIVEIEGQPVSGINLDEAIRRMKGPVGTKVTVTVQHAGKPERQTVTLTREIVHMETVLGDRRTKEDQWDFMYDHQKRIGYIRVTSFGRDTVRDLRRALEQLQKDQMRGLVLDLRFNPGGLLTSAIETCDLFIDQGRIVSTKGRNVKERTWEAQAEGTFGGFPMAILVNHYSASASEIVSACLQDHGRAIVVGERSWGKGSVQNVIDLEDGKSVLKLTTASYWRPNGKNIHRFPNAKDEDEWGVRPDKNYDVALTPDEVRQMLDQRRERDIVLPRGAENQRDDAKPDGVTAEPVKPSQPQPESSPNNGGPSKPAKEEKPAVNKPQSKIDGPEAEPGETQEIPAEKFKVATPPSTSQEPFVDKQLQKALDYLSVELAKAS